MEIKFLKTQEIFDTVLNALQPENSKELKFWKEKILNFNQGVMNILFPKGHVGIASYYITDFSSERTKGFFHSGESRKILVVNVSNFGYMWDEDENGVPAKVFYHKDIDLPDYIRKDLIYDKKNILNIDEYYCFKEKYLDKFSKKECDFITDYIELDIYDEYQDEDDEECQEDEDDGIICSNSIYEDLEIYIEEDKGEDDYERIDKIKEWVKNAKSSYKKANQNNNKIAE